MLSGIDPGRKSRMCFSLLKKGKKMPLPLHPVRKNTDGLFQLVISVLGHLWHSIDKSFIPFHFTDLKFGIFLQQIFDRLLILFR